MNSFDCNPDGRLSTHNTAAKIRRALSATLCLATATVLSAAHGHDGSGYRIGTLSGGTLNVKENALDAHWTVVAENVSSFVLDGDRIGVRGTDGSVRVKEGGLDAQWVRVADRTSNFAMSGDRIGILTRNGRLNVKEGGLGAGWVRVAERTQNFQLNGRQIAILMYGGALQMQDGSLDSTLTHVTDGVQSFQILGQRFGVLYKTGALEVRDGGSGAGWVRMAEGVKSFVLEGNRIAILRNGSLDVKEDGLRGTWVREADRVSSFKLSGDRIGVLQNGVLSVKSGGLSAGWVRVAEGVQQFQLQESRIVYQRPGGALLAKDGALDAPWVSLAERVQKFSIVRTGMAGSTTPQGGEIQASGSVTTRNGSDQLLGESYGRNATNFTRELRVGDSILINGGRETIRSIEDDNHLTMEGNWSNGNSNGSTLRYTRQNGGNSDSAGWQKDTGRGELTKTIVLDSSRGRSDGRSREVAVQFPAGYSYCRHSLSDNRGAGPGGVTVVSADPSRLVFGVWTGRPSNGATPGNVQMTATVTGINDNQQDDSACASIPETGGGCGDQSCQRYLNAAESNTGLCLATSCGGSRLERLEVQSCVYNLRADDQAQSRARQLACRNIVTNFDLNRR